jgi:CheY-like chemotaxis protein
MNLAELTPELVRRAVAIYMEKAWPEEAARPIFDPRRLEGAGTMAEVFALCETRPAGLAPIQAHFALRLGNESYPFMKLVLHEYLLEHEFFFVVDTHDDFEVPADNPDFGAWEGVRRHNHALKQAIEAAWEEAGVPTHRDMLRLVERRLAGMDLERVGEGERLLVVDDDLAVAKVLQALLAARGYRVEVAYDGRQVLERLARDPLPDLVVLDYAMPELDGQEVLGRMRADPRLARVPVLLATASDISLDQVRRVSGLLRKPYPLDVLLAMVARRLASERDAARDR